MIFLSSMLVKLLQNFEKYWWSNSWYDCMGPHKQDGTSPSRRPAQVSKSKFLKYAKDTVFFFNFSMPKNTRMYFSKKQALSLGIRKKIKENLPRDIQINIQVWLKNGFKTEKNSPRKVISSIRYSRLALNPVWVALLSKRTSLQLNCSM